MMMALKNLCLVVKNITVGFLRKKNLKCRAQDNFFPIDRHKELKAKGQ